MKIAGPTERRSEQGQTIAIVAVSLVSLLGMAALAIDVSALYVARNEAQRAADAAALGGARIFATSSFTSVPGLFTVPTDVCDSGNPGSTAAVNRQAAAAANENSVSNQPATITDITCNFAAGNPRVTVTVKQNNLPTFFSRMWSRASTSVSATSAAEAYNASGQGVPVQVTGVKPWLLANCDESNSSNSDPVRENPNCAVAGGGPTSHYHYFVNPGDGSLVNNASYIGRTISLRKMNSAATPTADSFYGLDLGPPATNCPRFGGSCVSDGGYRDDIQCSSPVTLSCGQSIGGAAPVHAINASGSQTRLATQCLIHSGGDDIVADGQDIFHFPGAAKVPVRIEGGDDNPNPSLAGQQNISRSDSVVTVPLYAGNSLCSGGGVCSGVTTIAGFMQLAIRRTCNGGCPTGASPGNPHLEAIILNAVGCPATGAGVSAGGSSPIAVRLIHQ